MRGFLAFTVVAVLSLGACAGYAPVPGGSEAVNKDYYKTDDDFRTRVAQLQPGMGESQVLHILGRTRNDMTRLSREEVVRALYGGGSMQMLNGAYEREETRAFLQSLYGYRLTYKDVKRNHGFSSPIRVRTQEEGFSYTVNLLFRNGQLIERPEVAGGVVHDSSSRTFFDYLNPGTVLGQF